MLYREGTDHPTSVNPRRFGFLRETLKPPVVKFTTNPWIVRRENDREKDYDGKIGINDIINAPLFQAIGERMTYHSQEHKFDNDQATFYISILIAVDYYWGSSGILV